MQHVTNDNAQGEYYLPDTLEICSRSNGWRLQISDFGESMGVNDRVAAKANQIMRQRTNEAHMRWCHD